MVPRDSSWKELRCRGLRDLLWLVCLLLVLLVSALLAEERGRKESPVLSTCLCKRTPREYFQDDEAN